MEEWNIETSAGAGNPWTVVGKDATFPARSDALEIICELRSALPPEVANQIRYRARIVVGDEGPHGLRALIKWRGAQEIADVLGTTPRNLVDLRGGYTALTVDDLYTLLNAYPTFDISATIDRLGHKRIKTGRARKLRAA